MNNLGLGFVFTAKDLASGTMARVKNSFNDLEGKSAASVSAFQSNFTTFTRGVAVFGAGAAALGGAMALADAGGRFLELLNQTGTLAHASAQEMEMLRSAAVNIALQGTGTSAEQAADALRELVMEGYNANEAVKALEPTLRLVAIGMGQISNAQAAGLVNDTLGEFKLGVQEAGPLVDKLALSMGQFGIRATELEPALRGVATGAALTGASLDDTLIALGLTKSVLPSVEQSARSVNAAFSQLASKKTQKELKAIGVQVTETNGEMRPLIEVLSDMSNKMGKMTEAQRQHAVASAFSARAGGGLTAIMDALGKGVKDAHGKIVTGTAAIEALRAQMAGAGGTAEAMRQKLAESFEGQKKGLKAAMATVATLIGEPFAKAFTPILSIIRRGFIGLAKIIESIPAPIKKVIATIVIAAGAFLAVVGAIIAAKGAFALLSLGLNAVGVSFAGVAASMAPVLLAVAAVGLVVAAFVVAFRDNVGGLADSAAHAFAKIKLAFRALGQLFSSGEFSGEVMAELNKAENSGIKAFAIRVLMLGHRIKEMFVSIGDGFSSAIGVMSPVFKTTGIAVQYLVDAIARLVNAITGSNSSAKGSTSTWKTVGHAIGWVAGIVAGILTTALNGAILLLGGIIDTLRVVGDALGRAAGWVFLFSLKVGKAMSMIYHWTVGKVIDGFRFLGGVATGVFEGISAAVHVVIDAIQAIIDKLIWAYNKAKEVGSFLTSSSVENIKAQAEAMMAEEAAKHPSSSVPATGPSAKYQAPPQVVSTMPAAVAAAGTAQQAQQAQAATAAAAKGAAAAGDVIMHAVFNVDGEKLAELTEKAKRKDAARSYAPSGSGG